MGYTYTGGGKTYVVQTAAEKQPNERKWMFSYHGKVYYLYDDDGDKQIKHTFVDIDREYVDPGYYAKQDFNEKIRQEAFILSYFDPNVPMSGFQIILENDIEIREMEANSKCDAKITYRLLEGTLFYVTDHDGIIYGRRINNNSIKTSITVPKGDPRTDPRYAVRTLISMIRDQYKIDTDLTIGIYPQDIQVKVEDILPRKEN